jgi:hypothetical protein
MFLGHRNLVGLPQPAQLMLRALKHMQVNIRIDTTASTSAITRRVAC